MGEQVISLNYIEIGNSRRYGDRMARVGVPIGEVCVVGRGFPEICEQAIGDEHRSHWHITRRQTLGGGDHVGHDAKDIFGREHRAHSAKRGYDFVADVEHVVGTADLHGPFVVTGRGHDDST